MTKGQRAMIAAKVRAMTQSSTRVSAKQAGTDQAFVVRAAIVLQYRPELADDEKEKYENYH